jgi:hypothetical protein
MLTLKLTKIQISPIGMGNLSACERINVMSLFGCIRDFPVNRHLEEFYGDI